MVDFGREMYNFDTRQNEAFNSFDALSDEKIIQFIPMQGNIDPARRIYAIHRENGMSKAHAFLTVMHQVLGEPPPVFE